MEWDQLRLPYLYIFSIFVLLAIGILDDRFDISPFLRAGIQAVLAILMIDLGNVLFRSFRPDSRTIPINTWFYWIDYYRICDNLRLLMPLI